MFFQLFKYSKWTRILYRNNLFSLALRICRRLDERDPRQDIFHSGRFLRTLRIYQSTIGTEKRISRIRNGRRYKALIRKSQKSLLQDLWLRMSSATHISTENMLLIPLPPFLARSHIYIYFFRFKLCALI